MTAPDSTPDRHDTAVSMRLAGYIALVGMACIGLAGVTWTAAGMALVSALAVLVLLLADEVDPR